MARRIAHSSARQRLSQRFACHIARLDRSLDRLFICSSMAFPTVWVPYGSTQGKSAHLWVHSHLPLVDDFANVLLTVDCSRRLLAVSLILPLVDVNYRRPVRVPYSSADGSVLLILALVNGFHDGLRAVLLSGWQRIAHTSARQRLSRQMACRIAPAADCSYFRSSTAFTTVCAPYLTADGSGLLILSLVNGFHDGFRAVLLVGSLAGSITLPLVRGFANCLHAVWLDGR